MVLLNPLHVLKDTILVQMNQLVVTLVRLVLSVMIQQWTLYHAKLDFTVSLHSLIVYDVLMVHIPSRMSL